MTTKSLGELARHTGAKLIGDADRRISSAATLAQAKSGDISFLAKSRYEKQLARTQASAVVVSPDCTLQTKAARLESDNPYYAFAQIVVLLHGHRKHRQTGISDKAFVAKTASLGDDCHINEFVTICEDVKIGSRCVLYPGVYVGPGTEIGDDCVLHPNAAVYENCKIGSRVIIQANATIGEDGFGFAQKGCEHFKIPHIGKAVIEDDVEIGAGCGIERGTLNDTVIGRGSKIGDLVAIGHGTQVGEYCLIVAQVGVAGSANIGHHCAIGGQSGIIGHINIGDMVQVGAQSGVINDVPAKSVVMGAPAVEASRGRRAYSMLRYLPEMRQKIKKLERQLAALKAETAGSKDRGD